MIHGVSRVWGIVGAFSMGLMGVGCVAIEAGHEGVLVEQPFFFGHGGVDPVPARTGRVIVALTTKVVEVDIRPIQFSEHFDIISAENAPVSFDAFLIANVIEGRSPELISKYGPNWYANNAKEAFRTFVRE
ncbi:MAG: hypothetical protein SGJ16_12525, partial [Nitrospirota bacterium]|nr:hypothetical protein [Nitrospirota bacterium]